ncbi:hypothetical protein [Nocardia fluminea]|uniref:hypothetical protein n=1 Tax=Nocardia fluminea TaxID=134984 RepID=UPI003D0C4DE5
MVRGSTQRVRDNNRDRRVPANTARDRVSRDPHAVSRAKRNRAQASKTPVAKAPANKAQAN